MELAEKVDEKRPSGFPEKFDPKFGDSTYLATDGGKSRLRGYIWTFGYMMFCGVLLIIGGGTFFIYESVVINRLPEYDHSKGVQRSARLQDAFLVEEKAHYSKELQTVAFVFIGVGAVLFMVGIPLATQFYRRYKRAKEVERSPILDPLNQEKKKKGKIYKEFTSKRSKHDQQKVVAGDPAHLQEHKGDEPPLIWPRSPLAAPSTRSKRRKSRTAWTYRSPKKISEGFRFAAHRHPSMNPITFDGINFPERNFSLESSPTSSGTDDDSDVDDWRSAQGGLRGFMNKLFGVSEKGEKPDDVKPKADRGMPATAAPSGENGHNIVQEERPRKSRDSIHSKGSSMLGKRNGYEELQESENERDNDLGSSTGGLYNLG